MRTYAIGEEPFETFPSKDIRYSHLWLGIVRRYDQDNEICDVEWLTYSGARPSVQIPLANGGPRTYLGGPPEEGALVFCDWIPHLATGNFKPVIVAYAPTGYGTGRRFELVKEPLASNSRDPDRSRGIRHKMPKLYSGDLAMVSSAGSHVIADENLHLASSSMTEMVMRSSDLSLVSTFLQRYEESAGSRLRWGMVERPDLATEEDPLSEDDRRLHYVTKGGDSARLEDDAEAWVEHRLQIRETSTGDLGIPETRFKNKDVDRGWLVESVLGTLVGENPTDETRYGKPLVRLVISGSSIARSYDPVSVDKESTAPSAVHLALSPGDNMSPIASLDLDKSGRLALSLGATSSSHPAGEGKSLQIAADGSLEAVFSGDTALDLSLQGKGLISTQDDLTIESGAKLNLQATSQATLNGSQVFLGGDTSTGSGRPY